MLIDRHAAIKFIFIYTVCFYTWIFLFSNHLHLRLWGANLFPLAGGAVSLVWLVYTYLRAKPNRKPFWLLLSIGVVLYFTANLIWFVTQVILGHNPYPGPADLLWISAYFFFLGALLYTLITQKHTISNKAHVFNILILMTVAVTISIYYLISPLLVQDDGSWTLTLLTIAYPSLDIVLLFAAINMYYIAQYSNQKKVHLLIAAGFTLQIIADTLHVSLNFAGLYVTGHWSDPLWQICLLLCGLAGLYEIEENGPSSGIDTERIHYLNLLFPYLSIAVLSFLVMLSYNFAFNVLSVGLFTVLLFTILRQVSAITENANLVKEYKYLAYHDSITGLYNRTKFQKDLDAVLESAALNRTTVGLILIDLDRFKNINDTMGHPVGDQLLKAFADQLRRTVPDSEQIYRIGGDEFVLVLENLHPSDYVEIAQALIQAMSVPVRFSEREIAISPSIGISMFPDDGATPEDLFKNADAAMYYAKEQGKNNVKLFTPDLNESVSRRMTLEHDLRKALVGNQFLLLYQPRVQLSTNEVIGMEALLRWNHPEFGIVPPTEFIPLAEETGQIVPIGEWVLRTASRQNKLWQEQGLQKVRVSVNVSIRQFLRSAFVKTVQDVLKDTGLDPQYLELEVTENVLHNTSESIGIISELKAMGLAVSLDDFGTGYSSMNILRTLPIDTIKIDKSFIQDMTESQTSRAIVRAMIEMCVHLQFSTVAEGIEHAGHLQMLKEYHCTEGQGYYFDKPLSAEDFARLLGRTDAYRDR